MDSQQAGLPCKAQDRQWADLPAPQSGFLCFLDVKANFQQHCVCSGAVGVGFMAGTFKTDFWKGRRRQES